MLAPCLLHVHVYYVIFVKGKADSWWIKDLNLYIADKNHLESGSEVSNNVINAVHTQCYPHSSKSTISTHTWFSEYIVGLSSQV